MKETELTELRRRALQMVTDALSAAAISDDVRQAVTARMAEVCDGLLVKLARHTVSMNRREAILCTQTLFVLGWPTLCEEAVPGMLLQHGVERIRLEFAG